MPDLVPGIHDLKTWMTGTSPATADEIFEIVMSKKQHRDSTAPLGGAQLRAGNDPLPNPALGRAEQLFGRCMSHQYASRDEGDFRGGGFHVGHDVRREDHDAVAGKVRKQIPEAHALLGV